MSSTRLAVWAAVVVVGLAGGVAASAVALQPPSIPNAILAVTVAGLGVILGGALAVKRFDVFVLVLTVIRPVLDGFHLGDQDRLLSPSTAIGMLFVVSSASWLLRRWQLGELIRPSPMIGGMAALLVAAALSCLVSPIPATSVSAFVRLLSVGLMLMVLEQLSTRVPFQRQLLPAVLAAACLVSFWSLIQLVTAPPVDQYTGNIRVQGPFVHPNVLAKFLVIATLVLVGTTLAVRGRWRLVSIFGVPLVVFLLVLTQTRIAWIAAAVSAIYLLGRTRWWLIPPSILVVIFLATIPPVTARFLDLATPEPVAGVPGNSFAWRVQHWADLLPFWRTSPINGVGLEVIPTLARSGLQAHNVWVQTLVEMGAVGMAALISLLYGITLTLRYWSKQPQHSTLVAPGTAPALCVALLIMSVGENLLNETTTLWYFAAALVLSRPSDASTRQVVAPTVALLPYKEDAVEREARAPRNRRSPLMAGRQSKQS